ncbi:MAG: hypothetical protein Q6367_012275 [Candidatus Freyarchaeota archaeon]
MESIKISRLQLSVCTWMFTNKIQVPKHKFIMVVFMEPKEFWEDKDGIVKHYAELQEKYRDKWVAVVEGEGCKSWRRAWRSQKAGF